MKKTMIASAIALAFTNTSHANEVIQLNEMLVTATRTLQSKATTVSDTTVITREEIERAGAGSLTDVLRMQPGVQISTNGGPGAGTSVFLRGTNADQVVVLVDGLRINSATLGTTSFENISLGQIDRIEILRGPASSLYGADAIGGVIQIFTRKAEESKPLIHASAGLGSFDTKTAEAGISGSLNALKYGVNVSSFDTQGFSAKRIRTGVDADDDGYRNLSASAYLELELARGHSWGLQFFESNGRSEFDNNFDSVGKQTLQSYAFTSKNQFADFWHSSFKLGIGVDDSDSLNSATSFSEFRTEQKQLFWQNDFHLPVGVLTVAYDRLEQNVKTKSNSITNINRERNDDSYLASYVANVGAHDMHLSIRENHNTQFGNYTTGGAGYGYGISTDWRVTASYGKAFRAPTFNQLYFPSFGSLSLQPEKSDNIEAAIKYLGKKWNASLTVFENNIRNLIASAGPATANCTFAGFCPVNIGKVEIQGATLDATWHITDDLLLNGNYTLQSPRDEATDNLLVRRSNRYGTIALLHTWGDLQWGAEMNGASTRYNNATNTKDMDGYVLVNATANYRISPEWKLEARANNILDKNYVLAYTGNTLSSVAYNTAGSNLFIGLRYDMRP